ncbi:MAG: hypothetical protein JRI51_04885 [Deltaproteobacteria bacterium]|nr:hypothetical protein [Deltaproteobacteria bacterium]
MLLAVAIRSHYYDPNAPHWYGLCYAWAVAAIMEEEPIHPGIYNGVLFRVGDKKALLTVLYDGARHNAYDIKDPVEFQHVLETFIKDRQQPIVMDLSSNDEVWNYPVYKYSISYRTEGDLRHYTTTIYYASDQVPPDFRGTLESSKTYYYWFRLSGNNIIDSGWEYGSESRRPKLAFEPLYPIEKGNGIDADKVHEIVNTVDDPYEDNNTLEDATPATSGRYEMLSLDEDWLKVNLRTGDRLKAMIEWEDGAKLSAQFLGTGQRVEAEMAEGQWLSYVAAEDGDHYIRVSTGSPDNESEYSIYIDQGLGYEAFFPIYQPGGWANGLSLITPQSTGDSRTILCVMSEGGLPLRSRGQEPEGYIGGILEEDFGISVSDKGYLRVDSDVPILGMGMEISGDYFAFGEDLIPRTAAASELFLPHFAGVHGLTGEWRTYFGLINIGEENEDIVLTAYGENGAQGKGRNF